MTIPNNLTHAEVGLLLIAVGQHMQDYNVAAAVVLDWEGYGDSELAYFNLVDAIREAADYDPVSRERAEEILGLTLEEAINYNAMEHPNAAQ